MSTIGKEPADAGEHPVGHEDIREPRLRYTLS